MKNIIQQFKSLFKSKAQIEKEKEYLIRREKEEKEELARREKEKNERTELARREKEKKEKEESSRQPPSCKHCGKLALSQSEFEKNCRAKGLRLDFSGNLHGGSTYLYRQLEDSKGFLCRSCGNVYCMVCLLSVAPMGTHGGKACPACGGQFQRLD
jgi:hypothetical protein